MFQKSLEIGYLLDFYGELLNNAAVLFSICITMKICLYLRSQIHCVLRGKVPETLLKKREMNCSISKKSLALQESSVTSATALIRRKESFFRIAAIVQKSYSKSFPRYGRSLKIKHRQEAILCFKA